MKKVLASLALLCTVCLNVQCQKAEIHKTDGTVEEIPVDEIDSITFSMTNPFNFETKTVKLNSGYEMPIIGIGTYLLSTSQAEESVYNALKVGISLMGIGGDEEVGVYLIHLGLPNGYLYRNLIVYASVIDDYDVLIGMNLISQSDFFITNIGGNNHFAFDIPATGMIG